jgi:hypothetical protein
LTPAADPRGGAQRSSAGPGVRERHVAWFHELDAWTEYWDIYHPETQGRYYFGDGAAEPGLLTRILPRLGPTPTFTAWTRMALKQGTRDDFAADVNRRTVAEAVMEVDALVARLFAKHFGDAGDPHIREDYLEAMFEFATDALPPAVERDLRIADDDPRKATAARHTLDGDLMWFAWALHTEAAFEVVGTDADHPRRALMLAGVASGCPANFAWRGHRRTRDEYAADDLTRRSLHAKGLFWATDFDAARGEVHALFRIREWGHDD